MASLLDRPFNVWLSEAISWSSARSLPSCRGKDQISRLLITETFFIEKGKIMYKLRQKT